MTRKSRSFSPALPRLALLSAALGVVGCVDEPADTPADALAAEDDDAAEAADADAIQAADQGPDDALPGFVRAPMIPTEAPLDFEAAAAAIDDACPKGQVCEAIAAPDARAFAIRADEAPRPRPIARESHEGRKRVIAAADLRDRYKNAIDLKLVEGSGVRARGGDLTIDPAATQGAAPRAEVAALRRLLEGHRRVAALPMHAVDEATLAAWKREGEAATGAPLPDLNLWLQVFVEAESDEAFAALINALNRSPLVELAEATPLPGPPTSADPEEALAFAAAMQEQDRLPWPDAARLRPQAPRTTTIAPIAATPSPPAAMMTDDEDADADARFAAGAVQSAAQGPMGFAVETPDPSAVVGDFTAQQTYRGPAPLGLDIDHLRGNYWNAWGDAWGYTDVEYNWNRNHADLGAIAGEGVLVNGTPNLVTINLAGGGTQNVMDHGTGVVGILSSGDNGFGTTGTVPKAMVRLSSESTSQGTSRAAAITSAAAQFWWGAVVLLEMQTSAGFDCNGDNLTDNNDLVPAEWNAAVKDAVKVAVANRRIVVAAAGNGNCDLDHASFGGAFSATDASRDSGAILVGAGVPGTRDKEGFSSFGARVDVQGQGSQITTTGYGDLHSADGYNNQYTAGFSGTSGASPMIVSAAVALASVLWEYHGSIYDPRELRDLLRRDGTPQGAGGHIGRRPDLRRQISHMLSRHLQMRAADFDGDGRDDYAVWRPSTGVWYIYYSGTGATAAYQWGTEGDIPVPANMTGDARAELVVYRPSNGTWHVRRWDGPAYSVQWGQNGDTPLPMDHDGDGLASPTVFRQANMGGTQWSRWYIRTSDSNYTWFDWGQSADTPLVGDFDDDGRDDFAVYRGTTGYWYIYHWTGVTRSQQWGEWGDVPLVHESGGRESIAVWRPSNGTFHQLNLWNNYAFSAQWGVAGDVPRLADTDGDGTSERIVYRPSAGVWYNLDKWWGVYWGEVGDLAVMR